MSRVICESAEHYREVMLAQKSCQHPMDSSAQPELCGCGPDYCKDCEHCEKPVCDWHTVELFGLGKFCASCALIVLDEEMATEAIAAGSVAA